jgi:acetyltransferase-like isoleucine patch superfamily enzyme
LGRAMSWVARGLGALHRPRMVYGFRDGGTGRFRKFTRVSSSAVVLSPERLSIGDHVWVWHYTIIDATEGIEIGEGAQIGAWVGIFTHGSENAVRLLGPRFVHIPNSDRRGYTRGAVRIGEYSFVGAGSIVLPGVTVGKGCLVATGALVNRDLPDYAVARGMPAKAVGDTRDLDAKFLDQWDFAPSYYDPESVAELKRRAAERRGR